MWDFHHIMDLLPGCCALVMLVALLLKSKRLNGAQYWMAVVLGLFSVVWLLLPMYSWLEPRHAFVFNTIYVSCVIGLPLSYVCFVRSLTGTKNIFRGNAIILGVWLLIVVGFGCVLLGMTYQERVNFMHYVILDREIPVLPGLEQMSVDGLYDFGPVMNIGVRWFVPFLMLLWIGSVVWSEFRLKRYAQMLDDYYSHQEGYQMWRNHWFSILGVVTLLMVLMSLNAVRSDVMYWWDFVLWLLQMGVAVGYGLVAFRTRFTAQRMEEWLKNYGSSERYEYRSMAAADARLEYENQQFERVGSGLQKAVAEEFYTDPDITLPELARRLEVNQKYLKDYLLFTTQASFSDYVNSHRVEFSKVLKREEPGIDEAELARRAGYHSLKSFRRCFRQFTGMNPEDFEP